MKIEGGIITVDTNRVTRGYDTPGPEIGPSIRLCQDNNQGKGECGACVIRRDFYRSLCAFSCICFKLFICISV